MNQENTKKMVERFPILYQDFWCRNPKHSCLYFGFETNDGWFQLLWDLSLRIEAELKYSWFQKRWLLFKADASRRWNELAPVGWTWFPYTGFKVTQVKEKYGMLCFYTSGESDRILDIILEAEDASGRICELCGKRGTIRGGGWITTRCDKCYTNEKRGCR